MTRYTRALPGAVSVVVVSALIGGIFGRSALATQDRLSERYACSRRPSPPSKPVRRARSSRTASSTAPSSGCCRRWTRTRASSIRAATRRCANARKAATTASASAFRSSTATSPSSRFSRGRPAYSKGVRRGDVIAKNRGRRTPRAGPATGRQRAARDPKGTTRGDRPPPPRLRRAASRSTVERDEINIPTIHGAFMIDDRTGYIRLQRLLGDHRSRPRPRARDLPTKGMKRLLLDLRDNPGGPLDQAIKVSNRFLHARRHDRLHARPRAQFRSGLPRASKSPRSRRCRSSCSSTATAPAPRKSSPARCRITIARSSSARRRSARRWCSRSIASAKAPAWR